VKDGENMLKQLALAVFRIFANER